MWGIINSQRSNPQNSRGGGNIHPDDINDCFTEIAHKIVSSLQTPQKDPLSYMNNQTIPDVTFSFQPVSPLFVRGVIDGLKNRNCSDIYGLTVSMIKSVKNNVIGPKTREALDELRPD
ncbi:hypothetical protein HHI36_009074 [Cryptolaemus montrouzieri]|uniref:Uncharacterized protein n=1 Tax=Cryptolaemus montrouzieri TaxID=559131 RepID=A0ABD2MUN6_9CUCU